VRQALAALLRAISGAAYPPRGARLDALLDRILGGLDAGATLSGCRILPRRQGLLVCREAAQAEAIELPPGREVLWDGRFRARLEGVDSADWSLGPLNSEGWGEVTRAAPALRRSAIPGAVRPSLPCLRRAGEIVAVPPLRWCRGDGQAEVSFRCDFAPKNPLTSAPFTVARAPMHII
jgi:tRNA(Ile)-lysidine synthase